jgi:hypothetical protein
VKLAALLGVEKRLLSEAVAADEKFLPAGVPERRCVHAVEGRDDPRFVLFVEVDQYLCVNAGRESVPASAERLPQLSVVVDLAVQCGPDGPVLVGHGPTSSARVMAPRRLEPKLTPEK